MRPRAAGLVGLPRASPYVRTMTIQSALKTGLPKVFVYALLALFLIPALTYVFTGHAQRDRDERFVAGISQRIDAEKGMLASE